MLRETAKGGSVNPQIYLLADHLDAVLSCGEDLLAIRGDAADVPNDSGVLTQSAFVESIRTLEARIVARVLIARDNADVVGRLDPRFRMMCDLFRAGTVPLAEAAADLADSTGPDFLAGGDAVAFLRSRGLIRSDAAGTAEAETLSTSDSLRLAGFTELGPLLDLAGGFLDALEVHYDLFDAEPVAEAETGADVGTRTAEVSGLIAPNV